MISNNFLKQLENFIDTKEFKWYVDNLNAVSTKYYVVSDEIETSDEIILYALVPGFETDEISITYHDNEISVNAETSRKLPFGLNNKISKKWKFYKAINSEEIDAKLSNGILSLKVKKNNSNLKQIAIS